MKIFFDVQCSVDICFDLVWLTVKYSFSRIYQDRRSHNICCRLWAWTSAWVDSGDENIETERTEKYNELKSS